MAGSQRVVCPKCQRSDRIQKVSTIVAQGTKVVDDERGFFVEADNGPDFIPFTYNSVARTSLARRLAPPAKPSSPDRYGCVAVLFMTRLGLAILVGLMLAALFFCSYPFLTVPYAQNDSLFVGVLVFGFAIMSLTLVWAVRASWRQARSTSKWNNSYDARVREWEAAYARWKQLYYCFRDNAVFIPGHSTFVPVERAQEYLKTAFKKK
jgi:hypothetical protein